MSLLTQLIPSFNRTADAAVADRAETTIRPRYTLDETAEAYTATVRLPGVSRENLEVTVEDGLLTVVGRRAWKRPEDWNSLYRESDDAAYRLSLEYDASVDVDKVQAEIRDGVLRLTLPKSEAAKPRKIAIQ